MAEVITSTWQSISTSLGIGVCGALAALVAGKFLRRLLILPFKYWSEHTTNKVDDILVQDAEQDLGLEDKEI